jgi:hypothetical protein
MSRQNERIQKTFDPSRLKNSVSLDTVFHKARWLYNLPLYLVSGILYPVKKKRLPLRPLGTKATGVNFRGTTLLGRLNICPLRSIVSITVKHPAQA